MYKLRFGRTYNMGNYQSERIEVERDYPDETTFDDAMAKLMLDVEKAHAISLDYLKRKRNKED